MRSVLPVEAHVAVAALPSIVNAVILISAFSAGNSDLFASSRTLYGLALDHKAPRFFRCASGPSERWLTSQTAPRTACRSGV